MRTHPAFLCHPGFMFDPNAYGEEVARILALDGSGQRLMPLDGRRCSSGTTVELLGQVEALRLFPASRAPEAAVAGLYLYFSCWDQAHTAAQGIHTIEGSYWHALVHRQEPDAANSAYWFRKVGAHPVFPELRERAAALRLEVRDRWDPFAFLEFCEQARNQPGSELERQAREVQLAEWQLLFDYCAGAGSQSTY
ncbi:MAG: hypothetical protein M1541_05070 [Acidobacteria bacterium]|nr:hypothetical protein [Acidobacteriota bacterium]